MTNHLHKLSHLNIDRAKGAAPHKPLLLLCLLEIAAEGLELTMKPWVRIAGTNLFNRARNFPLSLPSS